MSNKNKALNNDRLMSIFSQFEISQEVKSILVDKLSNDNEFDLFCKKYSGLHGKTKQVKKEFLLVLAYSMKDNFTISDNTNFQKQMNDAGTIGNIKDGLDILEKVIGFIPNGATKDLLSIPFFDGSSFIKNLTFAVSEYTNIQEVKDIVATIEENGHVELNSIIRSATNNKKLFYAYMAEMHKKEDSFIHNYIPKGHPITEVDVGNNFDNLLKELNITKVLYEKLSPYNKEIAFFCETNDLINIINKSIFYLKLNRDNLLNEKDHQFQPDVFEHYHHRAGLEIMKRCIGGEYEKLDNFLTNITQTKKTFLDCVNKNYNDHVQIIHEFYHAQTRKNINKNISITPNIDFVSIKNSLIYANNHLMNLKDYVASDVNMQFNNFNKIEKIENNIKLLIHNLKLYNQKQNDYKETAKLANEALSGNLKYSLPINLQLFEVVDINGKKLNNVIFNDIFNETSKLYQDLLIGNDLITNDRQLNVLMLSKSNFEIFKSSKILDEFAVGMKNKMLQKIKETDNPIKKKVLSILSSNIEKLMNENKGVSEDDYLGISMGSVKMALSIKGLNGDIASMSASSLKIMDKASSLLDAIKIISLNKTIYHNIDDIFEEINFINKKIVDMSNKSFLQKINEKISINKSNPKNMDKVKEVRDSVQKFLANNDDQKLDDKVSKYIKKKIK